jgi:hypothetical protein
MKTLARRQGAAAAKTQQRYKNPSSESKPARGPDLSRERGRERKKIIREKEKKRKRSDAAKAKRGRGVGESGAYWSLGVDQGSSK